MRIISKIIIWILSLLLVFIVANISIRSYKLQSFTTYIDLLNQKDFFTAVSTVSLKDPVSIFDIFVVDAGNITNDKSNKISVETGSFDQDVTQNTDKIITGVQEKIDNTGDIDPYDPEFEDEFESFFGDDSKENEDLQITGDTIDNTGDNSLTGGQDHEIAKELIKRFNE